MRIKSARYRHFNATGVSNPAGRGLRNKHLSYLFLFFLTARLQGQAAIRKLTDIDGYCLERQRGVSDDRTKGRSTLICACF